MSDPADLAGEIMERAMTRPIATRPMPEGVAGECDDCGRYSKRLVGGRCAPCRDGRTL
ncbi:conjugal transfer protein TraR [Sphingomonas paucimobilis]|uniref:conjugal transfer protein TraR n=1 Tax=Sphingomonas paucimobilis TaxID=13689 RepID=UPI0019637085|nr:conjugal transfer protein TraR [Sphingomonas paucimobilis]QRY97100.1 conjugal transfer protein TraR [Sphingomonas paucimobilis]QRY97267.1 conjugal transfer protein TraR [Sphingomonas paucimobilis]QRY97395.1 conjugal transfer protein TraR [Sphingomonas paucimobilis]